MDDTTLEALEYHSVLEELERFCSTPYGTDRARRLRPFLSLAEIEAGFEDFKEASLILKVSGSLRLDGVSDITELLSKTRIEGAYLGAADLLEIRKTLHTIARLKDLENKTFAKSYPRTFFSLESLSAYVELLRALVKAVDDEGSIKDRASTELARIRREVTRTRSRARSQLEKIARVKREFLLDELHTISEDRSVLSVVAGHHTEVPGVVHGRSASGATYYIEPLELVETNNALAILKREEMAEEVRILKALTAMVHGESEKVLVDLDTVGALDLTQAKALYGERLRAVVPVVRASGNGVRFAQARHPQLVSKEQAGGAEAVPIDITVEGETRVLVISGANAGGKTVALKTLGLLVLMAQSAMAVPAEEGSETSVFDNIFADIGDRQNIAEDLSTFSAHLKRTGEILAGTGPSTLVLIDEIGVGTDPGEGSALALAILEELVGKGALTVVTTHYNLLKAHAQTEPSYMNASVEFDEQGLRPLYRISYGWPGPSLGIEVARSMGMPESIINSARARLDPGERAFIKSIREIENHRVELDELSRTLKETSARRLESLTRLRRDRTRMLERARKKIDTIVEEASVEIAGLRQRLKEELAAAGPSAGAGSLHGAAAAAAGELKKIHRGLNTLLTPREPVYTPVLGDTVAIKGTRTRGVVESVDKGGKRVGLMVGGLKVWVGWDRLKGAEGAPLPSYGGAPGPVLIEPEDSPHIVNVIGMRVDEALAEVTKALDTAHMIGFSSVEIIHGKGTGALRKAIGESLRENEIVKSVKGGDPAAGGAGVTIVELV